jgi:4-hydroxy-3-methylbut-2-en-1-yl diphosphate synthase IspG/GcpE
MPAVNKILIPGDRTQAQPVRAFCRNVECLESSDQRRFEFDVEHEQVACPKCGATEAPMIGVLSLVHFLHRNPQGKIVGMGGLRYQLACDEKRAYLATHTNLEAATDQLQAVNCPGCLRAAKEKKLKDKQGLVVTG